MTDPAAAIVNQGVTVRSLFSPYDDTTGEFLKFIGQAQQSIRIMIFGFTLPQLADLLIQKHQQGIKVELMMDWEQSRNQYEQFQVARLVEAGIDLVIGTTPVIPGAPPANLHIPFPARDPHGGVMHTKAAVVDEEWVEDGSWNFSKSAPLQCNTINFIQSKERAAACLDQFNRLRQWAQQNQPSLQPTRQDAQSVLVQPMLEEPVPLLAALAEGPAFQQGPGVTFDNVTVRTLFAPLPYQAVQAEYLNFIGQARQSIHIMVYELRMQAIVDQLIASRAAGVDVHVILDHSMFYEPGAQIPEAPLVGALTQAGCEVVVGTSPCQGQIMHLKSTVVDRSTVWDGCWNYTPNADLEHNVVNIIQDSRRANLFLAQFDLLRTHMLQHKLPGAGG